MCISLSLYLYLYLSLSLSIYIYIYICIGYESGMHQVMGQAIAPFVEMGEGSYANNDIMMVILYELL